MHRTWPRQTPLLLGYEAAGVVAAAVGPPGDGELGVAVDDAVIAYPVLGAYASELIVPVGSVLAMPPALSLPEAANLLLVGTTAAEMLAAADVRAGETVLVHGASSATGISLLQQLGPRHARVSATSSARRFDLVRRFGAQPVTYGPGLVRRVLDVARDGVDVALDCVGTDEPIDASLELVADRDRILTIANAARAAQLGFRHLNGMEPASLAYRNDQRRRLIDMAAEGRLTVPMAGTLPPHGRPPSPRHSQSRTSWRQARSHPLKPGRARSPDNRPVPGPTPAKGGRLYAGGGRSLSLLTRS